MSVKKHWKTIGSHLMVSVNHKKKDKNAEVLKTQLVFGNENENNANFKI